MVPPWWARRLGLALLVYGVGGLLLLGAAMIAMARPLDAMDSLTVTLEEQRGALLASLKDTSRTLGSAADATGGFDDSLAQARASTERAAVLSRDVSATMDELSRSMRITVFGAQPLAQLAAPFERAGQQLLALGTDLDGIGEALQENSDQIDTIGTDLARLQGSVDRLVEGVENAGGLNIEAASLATLRLGLLALLLWLAGLAAGCVFAGLALLRWTQGAKPLMVEEPARRY
jgi:hypothetical protein